MKIIAFLLLALSSVSATTACQEPDPNAIEGVQVDEAQVARVAMFATIQAEAVTTELNRIKKRFELDDAWVESIKTSLDQDIDKFARRMAEAAKGLAGNFSSRLDKNLRSTMWEKSKQPFLKSARSLFKTRRKRELNYSCLTIQLRSMAS